MEERREGIEHTLLTELGVFTAEVYADVSESILRIHLRIIDEDFGIQSIDYTVGIDSGYATIIEQAKSSINTYYRIKENLRGEYTRSESKESSSEAP